MIPFPARRSRPIHASASSTTRSGRVPTILAAVGLLTALVMPDDAQGRNPIRREFFNLHPVAEGTQLDDLPSNAGHCGVCHFDFDGGGARNPYGLAIEVGLSGGLSDTEAILAIENEDSDNDGFSNSTEATDVNTFSNTPTFPGLSASNYTGAVSIPLGEIEPYLTPSGSSDTTPPVVTVHSPDGGEVMAAEGYYPISFTATDESGIAYLDIYLSDDGGAEYKPVAGNVPAGTGYSWFVPNRPGTQNRIRVEAHDVAGNEGADESDADFEITPTPAGYVPTTLRDMDMSGTQPHEGAILEDPDVHCASCHGNYAEDHEAWFGWRGSMMGQAARDPFFFACMAIAEQDAPSVGDLCIRCHSPGGWQEGRSVDTSGDLLNVMDRHGVQCDFCHRVVDHNYEMGESPAQDEEVLEGISPLPLQYANGEFINDPAPLRRGPYADAEASHEFVESPIHRSANMCGLCHDVSSPVFMRAAPGDYVPTAFDEQHPDLDVRNMFPVERTFSEWSQSEYASTGVYAPQFAGTKPDGIISTCQDCHMRDVVGRGCSESGAPLRSDLALHDFTGGNTFVPDIIATFFADEVDAAQLAAAKSRALGMLQLAATLEVTPEDFGLTVRVTNETGHKLPSGYPEGRRVWINVAAYDAAEQLVFESGAYDFDTGVLTLDDQAKIYEIHPGISPGLAGALGLPAGWSFHFVLSDTVYSDNRIPPRGSTLAGLSEVQSPVVDYDYVDGQHWDDTAFTLPAEAVSATVTLYYQSTSKEYIEFLRDENRTNAWGQNLYDAWVAQGKSPPVVIAQVITDVTVEPSAIEDEARTRTLAFGLEPGKPSPFSNRTSIGYTVPEAQAVHLGIYDLSGRLVRTLVSGHQPAGHYTARWDGYGRNGDRVASGIYFVRYASGDLETEQKLILLE